jgi:signal transduction histidine kinase
VGVANKDTDYDQSDIRQLTLLMDSTWKLVEHRRRDEERRQAAQKLQDSYQKEKLQREELQEEAKARGLFIDILAHELRTPLTPILASSGMLRDLLEGQEGILRKLTANLYNSADNMAHRLEELLDLARYARGTFKLNLQSIKIGNYLNDVIERSLPIIEQNKQILNLEITSDLPAVQIDSSRMEQVILNLLSNACKFSPEKSEIGFKARIESGYLQIDVQDQGIGIAAEDQEMLFQPYHRVVQDRQKYPGIGLGLAVAKQIVEAHRGKIWLTSQRGAGSTFSLCIPLEYSDK